MENNFDFFYLYRSNIYFFVWINTGLIVGILRKETLIMLDTNFF